MRLAPLYDLNSFLPYSETTDVDLAMRIGYKYNPFTIGNADWTQLARAAGVAAEGLHERIISLAERLPDAAADAVAETRRDLSDLTSRIPRSYARRVIERANACAKSLMLGAADPSQTR